MRRVAATTTIDGGDEKQDEKEEVEEEEMEEVMVQGCDVARLVQGPGPARRGGCDCCYEAEPVRS